MGFDRSTVPASRASREPQRASGDGPAATRGTGRTARLAAALAAVLELAFPVACPADNAPDAATSPGNADHGRQLFGRYCRGCHGVDGQGDGLVFMPHVNNLTKKGYIENLPDDYLVLAITKGGPGIGKSNYMPAWEGTLSTQDIRDVIAHIRSLPTY